MNTRELSLKQLTDSELAARALAVKALQSNNLIYFKAEHLENLSNPSVDISFESLDMDSLGRMELSIWLELELGLELTEAEIQDMASLNGLAQFIAKNYNKTHV